MREPRICDWCRNSFVTDNAYIYCPGRNLTVRGRFCSYECRERYVEPYTANAEFFPTDPNYSIRINESRNDARYTANLTHTKVEAPAFLVACRALVKSRESGVSALLQVPLQERYGNRTRTHSVLALADRWHATIWAGGLMTTSVPRLPSCAFSCLRASASMFRDDVEIRIGTRDATMAWVGHSNLVNSSSWFIKRPSKPLLDLATPAPILVDFLLDHPYMIAHSGLTWREIGEEVSQRLLVDPAKPDWHYVGMAWALQQCAITAAIIDKEFHVGNWNL